MLMGVNIALQFHYKHVNLSLVSSEKRRTHRSENCGSLLGLTVRFQTDGRPDDEVVGHGQLEHWFTRARVRGITRSLHIRPNSQFRTDSGEAQRRVGSVE